MNDLSPWNHILAEWVAALGSIAVAVVAVFQEWIKRRVYRPKLRLDARVCRPAAEKFRWDEQQVDVYYFRLEITNEGNREARDLQVYVASVRRLRQDGNYEAVDRFSPMNLVWTHTPRSPTLPLLLPAMPPRYCDLAHISNPRMKAQTHEQLPGVDLDDAVLALELEVQANSLAYLLGPGTYELSLKLAASNHPPTDYALEVKFLGKWFDHQDKMFSDGLGLRII